MGATDSSPSLQPVSSCFKNVCELFEDIAVFQPNATAVIYEGQKLTYAELDRRSNQLARYLRENGVQSEVIVALSLRNGLELLISILAILKAGGVYLPIDPAYPQDRIHYMLEDSKPSILVAESSVVRQLGGFAGKIIDLDRSWNEIFKCSEEGLNVSIAPHDLAYIIYTSGSTGKPKGIMIEHGSFAHAAMAHLGFYEEKLIALLTGSISFDVTLLTIFHSLSNGGVVCIPPPDILIDHNRLFDCIENNSINYILCVPSVYSVLLGKHRVLQSLKIVSLAGESIPNTLLLLHAQFAPNAILYNEYGPTEYAIGTTIAKIYDPLEKKIYPVTIGKPLPETLVYVLDDQLQPLPVGSKGEILIGGIGLARGYLNKPGLTSEKFIETSFGLLYRTGDFGRILSDGNIEFLGRIDYQVKIRGNRVELGEVEYAIRQHPEIDETMVIVRGNDDEHKQLVAYFTTKERAEIKQPLKNHLNRLLPKYMVPSAFVHLSSFPRTPNGKIDRNFLENIREANNVEIKKIRPTLGLEGVLLGIWEAILKMEGINLHDPFFELGGDSLQVAVMQTMIEKQLGFQIHVTDLFRYPTIQKLANYLSGKPEKPKLNLKDEVSSKKRNSAFLTLKKARGF